MLEVGEGDERDRIRAMSLLELPVMVVILKEIIGDFMKDKNYEWAASLYQRACEGSEADACERLGYIYELGEGRSRDPQRAVDYFDRHVIYTSCPLYSLGRCPLDRKWHCTR